MNRIQTRTDTDSDAELSVGILADDPALRDRLTKAVESAGIRQSRCVDLSGRVADEGPVDVAVLYDGAEGPALLESLCAERAALGPETLLIAVWPDDTPGDARRALRAGADGLVREGDLETALGPTIRAVSCGLTCIPQAMRAPIETESLSMREKQVLGMVVMGYSNSDIAGRLFLAESTVKSHLSSAYLKLGVRSRKDAANLILDPMEGLAPGIMAIAAG